ncbi:MAG: imidazole glycerol phosphate synthase subunit HisF [Planctomycetes bacterium]|nr:imidazole glycerol phosphate synthase subunit HisF [Planctomycetota bacterium]
MLKVRIIPTLLFKDVGLVKGVSFDSWRRVGGAMQAIKVYNLREVDELIFLDIAATGNGTPPDFASIDDLADDCFMPMTVGGGIRSLEDVRRMLMVGADKVSLNTAAVENPDLVRQISNRFGAQCVVISIDVRRAGRSKWEVYTHCGTRSTGIDPVAFAERMESLGAGEILLCSIDRDGTMEGYEIEITRKVSEAVSIPVIASGGAGSYEHMAEVLREGRATDVAAASIFHFTEQTPLEAKRYLAEQGFRTRINHHGQLPKGDRIHGHRANIGSRGSHTA